MKQKDIAVIVAVAGLSTIIALIMANSLIANPKNRHAEVLVLDSISSDFPKPDSKYFNTNSIDPTKTVEIGNSNNLQPFKQ